MRFDATTGFRVEGSLVCLLLLVFACRSTSIGDPSGGNSSGQTRDPLWTLRGLGAAAEPAYDGSTVYFETADHAAVAVDATNGTTRWRTRFGGAGASTYGQAGCVLGGEVLICGDDDIVALRRADGGLLWRFTASVGYSPGFFRPLVVGSTLVAPSPSGTMYALDIATGALRWTQRPWAADTTLISIFEPVSDGTTVYAGYTRFARPNRQGGVIAVDVATGALRWTRAFVPDSARNPESSGGHTLLWNDVVIAENGDGRIHGITRATGAIAWTLPAVGNAPPSLSNIPWGVDVRAFAVTGTRLIAASMSTWVIAYDLNTKSELWRRTINQGGISGGPISTDGTAAFVLHNNGILAAYDVADGHLRWRAGSTVAPMRNAAIIGDARIFAQGDSGFYAFSRTP
ncbi:hypothetical protein EBR44_13980 [bacterium]|nr:hypothetical protein [bacterium]